MSFRPSLQEIKERKRLKLWARGYGQGYQDGSKEMLDYFSEQVIFALHQDAVLSTNADIDTLERVVEIIEAVRDIGKTPS